VERTTSRPRTSATRAALEAAGGRGSMSCVDAVGLEGRESGAAGGGGFCPGSELIGTSVDVRPPGDAGAT
jgi:hypothetical protein